MKKYLLVLAACALTTACVEHECYEEVEYVRPEVADCGCQKAPACPCQKETTCGCQKQAPCGCHKAPAPAPAPVVMPTVQPKTVVVVVPAAKAPAVAPEIVYPEPKTCGCKHDK